MMKREEYVHWRCLACEVLEDYDSQHCRRTASYTIQPQISQKGKILKMASTSDLQPEDSKIASQNPKEQDPHFQDLKEMDVVRDDNSEGDQSQPSRRQLIPKKKQTKKRKGTPGARSKKGRDLDTFFRKMRKWIADHAKSPSFLPRTIRFNNLDHTLTYYLKEALSFLVPLAEQLLPDKPNTTEGRTEWHKRFMFKQRAQDIIRERSNSN